LKRGYKESPGLDLDSKKKKKKKGQDEMQRGRRNLDQGTPIGSFEPKEKKILKGGEGDHSPTALEGGSEIRFDQRRENVTQTRGNNHKGKAKETQYRSRVPPFTKARKRKKFMKGAEGVVEKECKILEGKVKKNNCWGEK